MGSPFTWQAAAWLFLYLLVGAYFVPVIEGIVRGRVAGRVPDLRSILAAPARRAAFLLLQQRGATERPDSALWALAPALMVSLGAAGLAAVPFGAGLAVADVPEGIVLFGAAMALVMVAVYLHGWAPNSPLPLIGGYRFVAVALSYEMPLAIVLIAAALPAESLAVGEIVRSQAEVWNVVRQPLGLPIYLVPALALGLRGPLNLADASDLSGGTRLESSGIGLLSWELGRSCVLVAVSAMGAAAFLGGWLGPWLPGPAWMALKTAALLTLLVVLGEVVGRVRIERFVVVSWVVLIPLALVDVFASGLLALLAS